MTQSQKKRKEMTSLESQLKSVAIAAGASTCGITSAERLKDAPPSADPTYVLKSAKSVVAFSLAFDDGILADYMAKKAYDPFVKHKKELIIQLFKIGDKIADYLTSIGHDAVNVSINGVFRPEPGKDLLTNIDQFPDFSHRYAAVAAGLGRIGWSGNVLTPQYGAAVELGSVITSAILDEDPLLEENPCDGCKSCVATCPTSMIKHREGKKIRMFGLEDEIAEKLGNMACYLGCSDYHGTSPNRKWSNWSPYRLEGGVPDDESKVDELALTSRKNDPRLGPVLADYRSFMMDPETKNYSNCGNCAYVCNGPSPKRNRARHSILKSGCVVLHVNGKRKAYTDFDAIIEVPTQFGENVAMLKAEVEASKRGEILVTPEGTDNIRDKVFLEYFRDQCDTVTG